jgi:hypothetical protein
MKGKVNYFELSSVDKTLFWICFTIKMSTQNCDAAVALRFVLFCYWQIFDLFVEINVWDLKNSQFGIFKSWFWTFERFIFEK